MSDPILPNATLYSDVVSANSDLKGIIWAKKVIKSTRERFIFKHFVGGESSAMPIVKKQDLAVGAAQMVKFITVAQLRGKGTLGENTLETATEKVLNGSFSVNVDYIAHAVSWTQSFAKIGPAGRNIDQWSSDALGDWWSRRQDDDFQIKLREAARLTYPGTNEYRIGGRTTEAAILSTDTLTPSEIEATKGMLIGRGATPMGMPGVLGLAVPAPCCSAVITLCTGSTPPPASYPSRTGGVPHLQSPYASRQRAVTSGSSYGCTKVRPRLRASVSEC